MSIDIREQLGIKGRFHLQAFDANGELYDEVDEDNVILDVGLASLAAALLLPAAPYAAADPSNNAFYAIQIGDDGALATDPMVPKVVDPAVTTGMFHELGARVGGDPDFSSSAVVGTVPGLTNAVRCQQTFLETSYAAGDFLDATKQYLNEAMLFLGKDDDASAAWLPFAMRTFKSIPFGPADAVSVLIRWTFEFQRGTV